MKLTEQEKGKAAWAAFLCARFAWGTDPKNPHKRKTAAHAEWKLGYDQGLGEFFRT
jgi:hypothetical protein